MNATELQAWLTEHARDIFAFTDYEATVDAVSVLEETLARFWFRDPHWNPKGYRLASLGRACGDGLVVLWDGTQASAGPSVVLFGSEGGFGVLCGSALCFAQALAYAPTVVEYHKPDLERSAALSLDDNWYFSDSDVERVADAEAALTRYRHSTEACLGPIPPFGTLIEVEPALQLELRDWVVPITNRALERLHLESLTTAEQTRSSSRAKAAAYALSSGPSLPAAHARQDPR